MTVKLDAHEGKDSDVNRMPSMRSPPPTYQEVQLLRGNTSRTNAAPGPGASSNDVKVFTTHVPPGPSNMQMPGPSRAISMPRAQTSPTGSPDGKVANPITFPSHSDYTSAGRSESTPITFPQHADYTSSVSRSDSNVQQINNSYPPSPPAKTELPPIPPLQETTTYAEPTFYESQSYNDMKPPGQFPMTGSFSNGNLDLALTSPQDYEGQHQSVPIRIQPVATQSMRIDVREVGRKPVGTGNERQWDSSVCGCCCDNCGTCCCATICPCIVYSSLKSRLSYIERNNYPHPRGGDGRTLDCCIHGTLSLCLIGWVMQIGQRASIRDRYRVHGSSCSDCMCAAFCTPCSLAQEEREVAIEERALRGDANLKKFKSKGSFK